MYFPAPRGLYRRQLGHETQALTAAGYAHKMPSQHKHHRRHIWRLNWIEVIAALAAFSAYYLLQGSETQRAIAFVTGVGAAGMLIYVQFLLFVWPHDADKRIRVGNFAQVHALRQNRTKELETLQ